jgi:hypothetical protein
MTLDGGSLADASACWLHGLCISFLGVSFGVRIPAVRTTPLQERELFPSIGHKKARSADPSKLMACRSRMTR